MAVDTLTEIQKLADALSGGRVLEAREEDDEIHGRIHTVVVALPAREALKLWLKLAERASAKVAVEWKGENNLSEDELADYMAKAMLASGLGPKALPGFNAIEAVKEAREG